MEDSLKIEMLLSKLVGNNVNNGESLLIVNVKFDEFLLTGIFERRDTDIG